MRRILLATHGRMADGVLSAVRLIMGDTAKMDVINAYLDGTPPTREFKEYFDGVGESDTVIVLTDLLGGSVNKEVFPYLERPGVFVIAGFNLAMVLELASMGEDEAVTEEFCRELVETGRSQVVFLNDHCKLQAQADDFFGEG